MNINKQILNKQRKLLIIIVGAIALAVTALWAINKKASTANTKESEALKSDIPETGTRLNRCCDQYLQYCS
ncbi:Uncharacterised protein [Klebsiella variicola]|uniref:Uncharacterized protein n=1 Tax=Klebsiella variicola TaxID=244366 RepID=A0A7H4M7M3_KLEVA|nr:Uncharacterised protein [Klebsiella variicola]